MVYRYHFRHADFHNDNDVLHAGQNKIDQKRLGDSPIRVSIVAGGCKEEAMISKGSLCPMRDEVMSDQRAPTA